MTSAEQRYAQIQKEALATTWVCEMFADFVLGKEFPIETDQKPLIPLLGSKCLQDIPPRIQRFWIWPDHNALLVPNSPCTRKDLTTPLCLKNSRMPASYRVLFARNTLHKDDDKVLKFVQSLRCCAAKAELFAPTLLAVQRRNYCSAANPNERRQSHHSLSIKAQCIRQDTHRSSRY